MRLQVLSSMRVCSGCGEVKPPDQFYSGRAKCKSCVNARIKKWRNANRERVRATERARAARNPEKIRAHEARDMQVHRDRRVAYLRNWRAENPEKSRAQNTLNKAIRRGTVIRPDICQQCARTGRIQAHHEDYSKPYEVWWLCRRCHYWADRVRREGETR